MKTHHKKSKRQKLHTRYNIAKRVRENKRRLRKQAKKMGVAKRKGKDPGIPNSWPLKGEMLLDIERKKEQKEKEITQTKAKARAAAKADREAAERQRREMLKEKEIERQRRKAQEAAKHQRDTIRKILQAADVIVQVLDARDPMGCRCAVLEAWAANNNKKMLFALAKADLVPPAVISQWLQLLAHVGPAVAVQAEAGRDGVQELLHMVGHAPGGPGTTGMPPTQTVGILGLPGTGKKTLAKALRKEASDTHTWLADSAGKLVPVPQALDAQLALHQLVRRSLPKFVSKGGDDEKDTLPLELVNLLIQRATAPAVMRLFRLPAFNDVEGMLKAWGAPRDMTNKSGNLMAPTALARRFLNEFLAGPTCACTPPPAAPSQPALWQAHGSTRQPLENVMRAQVTALAARGAGPTSSALLLSSGGMGPVVDLDAVFAEPPEDFLEGVPECDEESSDGDDGEEGGEEEYGEGDEEEDESMSDDE